MLLANIMFAFNSLFAFWFQKANERGDLKAASVNEQLENAFYAFGDLAFGQAHWILAMQYYKTAKSGPKIL